jgi:ribonuclease HI
MDEKIIQNCICKRAYTEWKDIDWKKVLNKNMSKRLRQVLKSF